MSVCLSSKRRLPVWTVLCVSLLNHGPGFAVGQEPYAEILRKLEDMEQRIEKLEAEKAELQRSLNESYISAEEPEVSARLKAVESQANSYRRMGRGMEALEGISAGWGLTMLGQGLSDPGSNDKDSEFNYRADATVSLPAGSMGNAQGFIYAHFRMGQGLGLENPGGAFSSVNGTSFQRPGSESSDSTVLLAQAWYELDVPLPLGGNPDLSRKHLEFNIGKIDPFLFFDQNSIADDETRGFINQGFIHNPLLDAGGDIGVDKFGFTPGIRLAWINDFQKPISYGLSMGVFGAGGGASFEDTLDSPFVIVQAETGQRLFNGLAGNYRLYAWLNNRAEDYDTTINDHSGVGISIDQQVADYIALFGRYGLQLKGRVTFDQAFTLGAEFGGSYWGRGADALGIAFGWLDISDEFRRDSLSIDGDGDGSPDFGYRAGAGEQTLEIYYRFRLNSQFELSPNLQYVRNPGGNESAEDVTAFGLRTQLHY